MATSKELLEQQLNQATKRKKPNGVEQALAVGISYNADLQRIVREVRKDINNQLMILIRDLEPQYTSDGACQYTVDTWVDVLTGALTLLKDKWSSQAFKDLSTRIANKFVRTANQTNENRFDIGIDVFTGSQALNDYLDASVFDNVSLIQSIPDQYLKQVESIVMTNVRAGGRPAAIAKQLTKQFDITEKRAKFIARDQTAKINGDLNMKRQQNVGFEYFQWITSEDSRVRDRHDDISDKVTAYGKGVYRWDNPPLSDRGTPIIPGQDFQCRCIARPVSNAEVDANQKAGRVVKGVLR
jgi:SPP1 gp7 family putative phage head morphogenesis protein